MNPKNAALAILLAFFIILSGVFLWQRTSLVAATAKTEKLQTENAEQKAQIVEFQRDIEQIKLHNNRIQAIAHEANIMQNRIDQEGDKPNEALSIFNDLVNSFNGMRNNTNTNPGSTKVLPTAAKAGSGKTPGPDYSGE
jgi:preprotein translocase subunit SecF